MNKRNYAIETRDLTRQFGPFTAVSQLNLHIPQGAIYGFIGSNGSGKSTTIRMLCGLLTPTAGKALVLGMDTREEPQQLKEKIGYMSQKFSLYHDLTCRENLDFYAGLYGLKKTVRAQRIQSILERMQLVEKASDLAGNLSGGQRQRLALGCAILHQPALLILDEPTSAVDPTSRRRFWNLLGELAEQGTTILVTTHFMDEAEHCDVVGFLRAGELIAEGTPKALKKSLPAHLFTLDYPTPEAARQALQQAAIPYLDAYLLGQKLHVLFAPDTPIPPELSCKAQELTMEDVFIYYDKQREEDFS